MSKLLKVSIVVFGLIVLVSTARADTDWFTDIGVDMPATGSGELIVTPMDGAISFNPGLATLATPWRRSDGYLRVQYTATYNASYVGVRIVSDIDKLAANGVAEDCVAPSILADGKKAYSGLIFADDLDLGTAGEDPSKRASLAWQVSADPQADITVPTSTVGQDPNLGGTVLTDYNGDPDGDGDANADPDAVGPWNAAWAYTGDKSDEGFVDKVWDVGDPANPNDDGPAYSIIVSGISAGSNGYLAQHPQAASKPGDGDIAVYLAGRFANTNWGPVPGTTPFAYVLPQGAYTTRLYLELIHE